MYLKEGSNEIMVVKSSKVKKIVVSVNSIVICIDTEQVTTSSGFLNVGQPVT